MGVLAGQGVFVGGFAGVVTLVFGCSGAGCVSNVLFGSVFVLVVALSRNVSCGFAGSIGGMDCVECGDRVPLPARGKTGKYCSGACRQRAYRRRRAAGVPSWLKGRERWTRADHKRPITPGGLSASSTNPDTWGSYADCQAGAGDGYGVMLGDGLGCIDLDGCLDGGRLSAVAESVLAANPGAYVEVSMSGRGLHVFGQRAEVPGRRVPGVEVYSRGRFIRVTGNVWDGMSGANGPAVLSVPPACLA